METYQEAIQSFCAGCDLVRKDGTCRLDEPKLENDSDAFSYLRTNQARYALGCWCGWAKVNGVNGNKSSVFDRSTGEITNVEFQAD